MTTALVISIAVFVISASAIMLDALATRRERLLTERSIREHFRRRSNAMRTNDCLETDYWRERSIGEVRDTAESWLEFIAALELCGVVVDEHPQLLNIRNLAGGYYMAAVDDMNSHGCEGQ